MCNFFLFAVLVSETVLLSQVPPDNSPRQEVTRLIEQGDLATAELTVRAYLSTHEASADAHYLLGYVLFKKRDAKSSLAEYTIAARYRIPNSYDLEAVASDYVLLKDYPDADKWFTKSVDLDPANFSALYYLGRTKYNENRFDEAIVAFEQCLKHEPKNVKYEDNLGLSYQGLGRNQEAELAFRAAIEWDRSASSHNFGPYLDLGRLLVDTDRPVDAIPYLVEASHIAPNDLSALTQLGKAYLHAGRLEEAEAALEAAVKIDPRSAPTHFVLAQVYRKRGWLDKAREESKTYTNLNHDHSTDQ